MAYKFQLGDARLSGSLTQEEGITVDSGGLTVTAGGLTVTAGGANLNASGVTNAGAISQATTISASSNISGFNGDFEGAIDALGGFNASGGSVVAAVGSVSGAAGLAGLGLQISNGSTIGTNADTDMIKLLADAVIVNGDVELQAASSSFSTALFSGDVDLGADVYIDGSTAAASASFSTVLMDGAVDMGSTLKVAGSTAAASASFSTVLMDGAVDMGSTLKVDGVLDAGSDVNIEGGLDVDGATTLDGAVTLGNATEDDLTFTGRVASNFVPKTDSTSDLGTTALRWSTIYVDSIVGASVAWDVVVCDASNTISASAELAVIRQGNGVTVNLPAAAAGRNIRVKLSSSVGDVIIAPQSGEFIDGSTNSIRLESTGSAVTFAGLEASGWVIL